MSTDASSSLAAAAQVVIPGQVLAVSAAASDDTMEGASFLRGHGTYVEAMDDDDPEDNGGRGNAYYGGGYPSSHAAPLPSSSKPQRQLLVASTVGLVQRVNKLVSVPPVASLRTYTPRVGDLVVGRVLAVTATQWVVALTPSAAAAHDTSTSTALPPHTAVLPLQGVYLPGGAQRMRTASDARTMRDVLAQGDLVAAEIHKVTTAGAGTVQLHTRSSRYGKLENGVLVAVPPALVPRRKQHVSTLRLSTPAASSPPPNDDATAAATTTTTTTPIRIIFGCNGYLWLQRDVRVDAHGRQQDDDETFSMAATTGGPELVEWHQRQQAWHAATPTDGADRRVLARCTNVLQALVTAGRPCTVAHVQALYQQYAEQHASDDARWLDPDVLVAAARRLP